MTRTHRWLPVLSLLIVLATACSRPKDRVIIEGEIAGVKQAEFYVYCEDGTNEEVDTVRIDDGSFVYERLISAPTVLTLLYPNFTRTYLVAEPGKLIQLEGNAARLGEAEIKGTEENDLLTTFRLANAAKPEAQVRLAAEDFIRSHPQTLAAATVFKRYFADRPEAVPETALSLLKVLKKAQPGRAYITALAARLEPLLTTAPGLPMPEWQAPDIEGDTLSGKDFSGKPYVVAFYAAWSTECSELLRELRRLRTAYPDRLGIVAVSTDYSVDLARRRADRDSLEIRIICDGEGIASPIARRMGLRFVPGCIVVDRNGRIAARDVSPGELERKVEELL